MHIASDSVPYEALDDREPRVFDVGLHVGRDLAPELLLPHQADRQIEHPLGDLEELSDVELDSPDA